jgi:hypothetical protein
MLFASQQGCGVELAGRIGTMDEVVGELLDDVVSGFERLLARHAEFDAWLRAEGRS